MKVITLLTFENNVCIFLYMTKYGIRNIEKNEEFLGSWTVRETRVSPAHEGDWSNSHVEWSSPISPQLKCSEHVLRFNIKCVCDTIILAGKSRWLRNCTRHYSF